MGKGGTDCGGKWMGSIHDRQDSRSSFKERRIMDTQQGSRSSTKRTRTAKITRWTGSSQNTETANQTASEFRSEMSGWLK
mmetsp:Transcript_16365/g.41032  ORF Transcript_16365/g.41032 Transcript_16365/m.41032 type:complete len:80 (+) Transcript_16365:1317-1556(+)